MEKTKAAKEKYQRVLSIFWTFLKFGCFTFGGGWSIIAQMQKEYVEKKHWITDEELLDFTSVGRSVPGLMVTNASVLFGYQAAGFLGALAAFLGIVIPPFVIMYGVTNVYALVRDNLYVARAMMGVRAAVVPIILCAMLKLVKSALKDWPCYVIALCAALLCLFSGMSNILIVVLGAVAGLLIMEVKSRHGVS